VVSTRITKKTCFLVADKDWRAIFGLIPISYRSKPILDSWTLTFIIWLLLRLVGLWTPLYKFTRRNPVLVFHEEVNKSIDADSIICFLQQFGADKLIVVGDTPDELDELLVAPIPHGSGLAVDSIFRIYPKDYPDFWSSFTKLVVVDRNNYRASLMGSVYASLLSIPVIFVDNSNLDDNKNLISGKKVYVVGNVTSSVSNYISGNASSRVNYSVQAIIEKYIYLTRTRKIIMVNPQDLDIKISTVFQPDKSANEISELFTKDSITAPILAAGRHEIIIFPSMENPGFSDFDNLVENFVNEKIKSAKYLTIIGSPSAIPQSIPANPPTMWGHRLELDGRHYGSLTNLGYVDLATGRIYGISPSDSSSNIARSIFYDSLIRSRDALVLPREDYPPGVIDGTDETELENYYRANYWTSSIECQFNSTTFHSGHSGISNNLSNIRDRYDEVDLVLFADHGTPTSFSGIINSSYFESNSMYLKCPTVIDLACSTGEYDKVSDAIKPNLFNVQSIRRGAIVQLSAVSVSYWHQMFDELLGNMYLKSKSLGEAFRLAKNSEYDRNASNYSSSYIGDPYYFLMGDPVFAPKYWGNGK
jgi:hypothetical protein